jgi:phosphopantetheine adenylyltransferase
MRIIIDTELNKIIVPNSFFNQIDKMNKLLEERGAGEKKIDYTQYVKDAYEKAISSPIVRQSDIKR